MKAVTTLKVDEVRLGQEILVCLNECGLKLVRTDGKDFDLGYSPTLAMGQTLAERLKFQAPAVYVHTMEMYDPNEECPSA